MNIPKAAEEFKYLIHPAARVFPHPTKAEYDSFKADIKANGQRLPIIVQGNQIVDGKTRYQICQELGIEAKTQLLPDGVDPWSYAYSANFTRRHLTDDQRAVCAAEWARSNRRPTGAAAHRRATNSTPTAGGVDSKRSKSQENPAKLEAVSLWRVSGKKHEKAVSLINNHPELAQKVKAGELSIKEARQEIHKSESIAKLDSSVALVSGEIPKLVAEVKVFKMEELLGQFNGEIDAIISDPPYSREYLSLYGELARLAKTALKPSGVLAVMAGQSYLPEVMGLMTKHLEYRWTLACLTGSKAGTMWNAGVNTRWKPILVFGGKLGWPNDVITCDPTENDKDFHKWGQNLSGMKQLVGALTQQGQLICDPFLGAGTTGVAAVSLGRRFIGCDIVADKVEIARKRIALELGRPVSTVAAS